MRCAKVLAFLAVIASICAMLLAGAQMAYEKAAETFRIRLYERILTWFDLPAVEGEIAETFAEHFETRTVAGHTYYIARQKHPGTVVFKASGPGLWARIELLLAVEPDGETLHGMRVIAQAETPGLGGRITERDWQASFSGVATEPEVEIVKFSSLPNEVDAVTGATRTSQAVEDIINEALARARSDLGLGGQ